MIFLFQLLNMFMLLYLFFGVLQSSPIDAAILQGDRTLSPGFHGGSAEHISLITFNFQPNEQKNSKRRSKRGAMKALKEAYKETFYMNPAWFFSHNRIPTNPYIATVASNYFPEPQYGQLNFQNFPPPTPPPANPNVGPQVSNFAGYVGPVGWLPEAYENAHYRPDNLQLYDNYKYYDS